MAGYRLRTLFKMVAGGWLSAKDSLQNGLVAGYRLRTLYKMVAGVWWLAIG
jgi:hypothetical protein